MADRFSRRSRRCSTGPSPPHGSSRRCPGWVGHWTGGRPATSSPPRDRTVPGSSTSGTLRRGGASSAFRGHDGDITDVAFSPDGSMLATTGVDGFLKVWDPSNGALLTEVSGVGVAQGTSFSEDGKLAAAAWPDEGAVRRREALHGSRRSDLRGSAKRERDVLRSRRYADRRLEEVPGPGGRHDRRDPAARPGRTTGVGAFSTRIPGVRWTMSPGVPTATSLASGSDTLMVWDAESGERLYSVPGSTGMITSLDWWAGSVKPRAGHRR